MGDPDLARDVGARVSAFHLHPNARVRCLLLACALDSLTEAFARSAPGCKCDGCRTKHEAFDAAYSALEREHEVDPSEARYHITAKAMVAKVLKEAQHATRTQT